MKLHKRLFAAVLAISFAAWIASAQTSGKKSDTEKMPGKSAAKEPATTAGKSAAATPSSAKIDINSASKEELMTLPGIGDATAQKIIEGRPYKSKAQLKSKTIVPDATYDKISDRIIAHQNTAKQTKP